MVFYAPAVIVIFLAGCGVVKMKKPAIFAGADTPLNGALTNYKVKSIMILYLKVSPLNEKPII